jgi:cold shock CspA family protein/ribosome-associated translation inhibitor RaiA
MELPLSVTFRGMESSPAIETDVGRYIEKLERRYGRIVSCRVVVEAPNKRHVKGNLYRVSVDLKVPGREIASNNTGPRDHAHEDMHVAIRDAFQAVERRLQDHARKTQGVVKVKETPSHGHIRKLIAEEDYGFIETPDGTDVYFHRNAVANNAFDRLKADDEVRFVLTEGEKGPQASVVKPVGKHHITELP